MHSIRMYNAWVVQGENWNILEARVPEGGLVTMVFGLSRRRRRQATGWRAAGADEVEGALDLIGCDASLCKGKRRRGKVNS